MVRLRRSLALLALVVLAAAPHAGAAVLGNPTLERQVGGLQNVSAAFPVTATAPATYTKIAVYVEGTSTGTRLSAGIYADSGGHPGALLAAGAVANPVAGTWNDVAIPATTVVPGQYWLALLGSGGTLRFRFAATSLSEDELDRALTVLPPTWVTGTVRSRGPFSAYATGPVVPPTLQVSPASLSFTAVGGAAPTAQSLAVANGGDGLLDWITTTDAPWLSVFPQSGVGPGSPAVGVSATGLAPGTYTGTVTVSAAGAQSSPVAVRVTLTVTDATPPTVRLTAPADGAAVRGAVDVNADAADDVGVAGVQFRVDGADLGAEDTAAPYSVPWPTGALADGAHTLTAVARDAAGNTTASAPVTVRVDNTAPTVSITAPSGTVNAAAADPLAVAAATTDTDVAQVELFGCSDASGGCATGTWVSLGVDTAAPYAAPWPLPGDGNRALRAVATDAAGNTGSAIVDVAVDRTAPAGSLTAPAAGAILGGAATLNAAASDARGVASVRFERSLAGAATWTAVATSTSAPYGASLDTTALADGAYDLRALVTDVSGNTAVTSSVRATVDNGAPTVTLAALGGLLRGAVSLSATAADGAGSGVTRVVFERATTAAGPWTAIATDTAAPYAAAFDTRTVGDGIYLLRATATDAAGNSAGSAAATVRVDNVAPTVSITAPRGPVNVASANPFTVTAASADADVAQVEVFSCSDASTGCATGTWTSLGVDATAPYSAAWTLPADGNRALRAVATDAAGNTGAAAVDVAVDRTVPTAALTAPAAGAALAGTTVLTADAADGGGGVASVRFERLAVGAATWTPVATATAAPYSTTLATSTLPDGAYGLRAVATDRAGNSATSVAVAVSVDNAAPTVAIGAPQGSVNAAAANPFTVTASTPDADVRSVAFSACSDASAGCATGTWTALGTDTTAPYSAPWALPADGNRALRAVAADAAGNTGGAVTNVSVDRTPPTGSITAPAAGSTVSGVVSVTAGASDNLGVSGVQLLLDGAALGAEDTSAPYAAAWDTTTAAAGSHTLAARVRDGAGNTVTTAAVTVTVASVTPPPPPLGGLDTTNAWKRIPVGPGFVDATARQVVRTAADQVYVFAADDTAAIQATGPGIMHAYKGNVRGIPSSFAEVDAANRPRAAANNNSKLAGVDLRLDRSGIVHMVYVDNSAPITLEYRTFDTGTDRWGPKETIASGLAQQLRGRMKYALILDNSDKPHVVYMAGTSVVYTNRVGGTWSAPQTLATTPSPLHPALAADAAGAFYLAWLDDGTNPSKILFKKRAPDGTWSANETVVSSDVLTNANADQGPSLVVTPSGKVALLYVSALPVSAVRVKVRAVDGTWTQDPLPADIFTHTPQIYSRGEDLYVFLGHDAQINYGYTYKLAGQGWAPYTKLTTVADDGSASIRWDPQRETNPNVIDTANFNEDALHNRSFLPEVYYFAAIPQSATPAPGDTTPPATSVTAPAAGATLSGTTTVSASASDNVGVASVQFRLDGALLGAEDTAAPYAVAWDTATAADGAHTLTAVARDAAGNVTTSAPVSVTVSNAPAPPPSPPADTTPPTVAVTAPAAAAILSGTTTLSAAASDAVGVAGVGFKLDGALLGAEDTTSPYSVAWDTRTAADGTHTLTAVARDAAGNLGSAAVTVTVANGAPAPAPPPASGLVAAYAFDAGQGLTLADSSGVGNLGTLDGPTWTSGGHSGGALSFDGLNDIVSVADADSLDLTSGMTLEAWVRPTVLGTAWRTVLMKENATRLVYALYANSNVGRPVGDVYVNGFFGPGGPAQLPLDTWTHLAVTFDGAAVNLLVNGTVVVTRTAAGAMLPSTGALRLGGNSIVGEFFAGLIDDVRVYNRALSTKDVQTDMTRAVGP